MATLTTTTITGRLTVLGQMTSGSNSDQTPWYKISYTDEGGTQSFVHVRLPLPADTSYLGWNPSILEVLGYNGYSGDKVHDFKALLNVNGYDNTWYGSLIPMNDGYQSSVFVYRSTNTYGGVTRVCFSVNLAKTGEPAHLFIRWWNNMAAWNSFAWAYTTSSSNSGVY